MLMHTHIELHQAKGLEIKKIRISHIIVPRESVTRVFSNTQSI